MKIAVTGARGLLGWHTCARLHAQICAARFSQTEIPLGLVPIDRAAFEDANTLASLVSDVDVIIHFAGVNRGEHEMVEKANPAIAEQLISACRAAKSHPHIIYANSTHAGSDTSYGRSKRIAGEKLADFADGYTDLVLPHIFGECARPNYNNVTATLIDDIWNDKNPNINPEGRVQLLHAGEAAQIAIDAAFNKTYGRLVPEGRQISVQDLYEKIANFHRLYQDNIFPDLGDAFDLNLFNSYRTAGYPAHYPFEPKVNRDDRGILFESAKGGNAAQSFLSTTHPGVVRGNHFHLNLVERFLVVKGKAIIRIRRVLTDDVVEFRISGDTPAAIDMPPLHTHHIENVGEDDVITFFWSHHIFDPANPDTYADPVFE
mgnify:CR=1 FL=1|tara:strand:- start:2244 stop:3365 length:1122 start_codon:yes stop_codon:yes gene_type:complete